MAKTKFDTTEVLEKAMALFWEHGFQACSMARLKTDLNLSASSIYHAWGSKDGLFEEVLVLYKKRVTTELAKMLDSVEDGRQSILDFFQFIAQHHSQENGEWGCLSTNTIAELSIQRADVSERLDQLTNLLEEAFRRAVERGQAQGSIASKLDSAVLASFLMVSLHGIHIRVKAGPDKRSALKELVQVISQCLN